MSNTIKVIHACNHVVPEVDRSIVTTEFLKSDTQYDTVCDDTLECLGDVEIIYAAGQEASYRRYYAERAFERFGQNKIRWMVAPDIPGYEGPAPGTLVKISVNVKKHVNRSYDGFSCPRCNGNAWYVSLSDDSKTATFITGSDKMVQDFLKILLTDVRYYTPGTAFLTLKGTVKREEKTRALIEMYVKDAETQLKQLQYALSIDGSEIDAFEELKTVIIDTIDMDSSPDSIYIELYLVNLATEYTSINLEI